ncbi:unnamed protein product [Mortierella alpina]
MARFFALPASLGLLLCALQSAQASGAPQLESPHKRGDTVYVTVTEVRYVPIPAPAPATAAPVATMRPAHVKPDLDHPALTTAPSMPAASPASTWSSVADKASPTTAVATSSQTSSRSKVDESITLSEEKTDATTTSISRAVTVSTTTTTQGSTTKTTTTVGSDGTTTVLTEYPTSTRPRGSQNTSGAQAGQSRGRLPSSPCISSAFEYLTGCAILGPAWLALVMTLALAAGCPLLLWV